MVKQENSDNPFLSLWKNVYENLKNEIITIHRLPGEKINEYNIAKELGISRSPVKMAINQLLKDNLLEQQGSKIIVAPMGYDDYLRLCDARAVIEGKAAFLTAKKITNKTLKELERYTIEGNNAHKQELVSRVFEFDENFHKLIIRCADNIYLENMYECISDKVMRYRYYVAHMSKSQKRVTQIPHNHIAVYHALKLHSSYLAEKEIVDDILLMREAIMHFPANGAGGEK